MIRIADAKAFMDYLGTIINKKLINKVKPDGIVLPIWRRAQTKARMDISKDIFYDLLTDRFMDKKMGHILKDVLIELLENKLDISYQEARKILNPGATVPDEITDEIYEDLNIAAYRFIKDKFSDMEDSIVRTLKKSPEESIDKEDFKEISVPSEIELKEKSQEFSEFEEKLVKKLDERIERAKKDPKAQKIYKAILRERIIKELPLQQVSKDLNIPISTVSWIQKNMENLFKGSLRKLEEEVGMERGEAFKGITVPKYTKVLTNKKDSEDLKDKLKIPRGARGPEGLAAEIMDLLAEGKSMKDIASELDCKYVTVAKTYNQKFKSQYENWYRNKYGQIKKALHRIANILNMRGNMIILPYSKIGVSDKRIEELQRKIQEEKRKENSDEDLIKEYQKQIDDIRKKGKEKKIQERLEKAKRRLFIEESKVKKDPEKIRVLKEHINYLEKGPSGIKKDEGKPESSDAHLSMIKQAIKDHRIKAQIKFSSDYDYMDLAKNPEKYKGKDPNFKWVEYIATVSEERKFGKNKRSFYYIYRRDLSNKGTFEGSGASNLRLDNRGEFVAETDEGKELLDEYVEKNMIPEGVIPLGKFPVEYINVKKPETVKSPILSIESFVKKYPVTGPDAIAKVDPKFKERAEKYERFRRKREMGKELDMTEQDAISLQRRLKRDLRKEKMGEKNIAKIKDLEKQIKLIDKYLEMSEKGTLEKVTPEMADEFEDLVEEYLKAASYTYEKISALKPPSDEIMGVLKEYGLDIGRPNPKMWMSPADVKTLAKSLRTLAEKMAEEEAKDISKPSLDKIKNIKSEIDEIISPVMATSDRSKMSNLKTNLRSLQKNKASKKEIEEVNKELDELRNKYMDSDNLRPGSKSKLRMLKHRLDQIEHARGMKIEERKKHAEKIKDRMMSNLQKARRALAKIPEDLKKRRDALKASDPAAFKSMSKRNNLEWVDNLDIIRNIQDYITDQMSKSSEELKKIREKKIIDIEQPAMAGLEQDKFRSLQGFLNEQKEAFGVFADRLDEASIKPIAQAEMQGVLEKKMEPILKDINDLRDYHQSIIKERNKFEKADPEIHEKLKKLEDEEKKMLTQINTLKSIMTTSGENVEEKINNLLKKLEVLKNTAEGERSEQQSAIKEIELPSGKKIVSPKEITYNVNDFVKAVQKDIKRRTQQIETLEKKIESIKEISKSDSEESSGLKEDLSKDMSKVLSNHDKIMEEIKTLKEDKEVPKEIVSSLKKVEGEIKGKTKELETLKSRLKSLKKVPAVLASQVLLSHTNYFTYLYSPFTRTTHFRDFYRELFQKSSADIEISDEKEKKSLKNKVVSLAKTVSARNIRQGGEILKDASKLRGLIHKFIDFFPSEAKRAYEKKADEKPLVFKSLKDLGQIIDPKAVKKEELREKQQDLRVLYPHDALRKAYNLVFWLKKENRKSGEKAGEELEKILKNVGGAFDDFNEEKINEIAKENKESPAKIAIRMKMLHRKLASKLLESFLNKWMDIKEKFQKGKEKEKKFYDTLEDVISKAIPDITKLVGTGVTEELTIPTEKKIVDKLVDLFEKEPGKSFEKEISAIAPSGKGGGPRTKGRAKPMKVEPPSLTKSRLKDIVIQHLKKGGKGGRALVKEVVKYLLAKTKNEVKKAKEQEQFIGLDTIVDGFVSTLKNLYFQIKSLKVQDPRWGTPPPTQPAFVGSPEIPINDQDDAERLLDEIVDAYNAINALIEPDEVGIPPASLNKLRKPDQGYLPYGLTRWAEVLRGEGKKEDLKIQMKSVSEDIISHIDDILKTIKDSLEFISKEDPAKGNTLKNQINSFIEKYEKKIKSNFIIPEKEFSSEESTNTVKEIKRNFDFGGGTELGRIHAILKKMKDMEARKLSDDLVKNRIDIHKSIDEFLKLLPEQSKKAYEPDISTYNVVQKFIHRFAGEEEHNLIRPEEEYNLAIR